MSILGNDLAHVFVGDATAALPREPKNLVWYVRYNGIVALDADDGMAILVTTRAGEAQWSAVFERWDRGDVHIVAEKGTAHTLVEGARAAVAWYLAAEVAYLQD